jgi:hypothetical protein
MLAHIRCKRRRKDEVQEKSVVLCCFDGPGRRDFWKRYDGQTITVYRVEHSTSAAVQQKLMDFEAQTGINVNIQVTPESNYFRKFVLGIIADAYYVKSCCSGCRTYKSDRCLNIYQRLLCRSY